MIEVRLLGPEDAEAYFANRLEALEGSPRAFSASPENFRERGVEGAAKMLEPVEGEKFAVGAWAEGRLVGTAGISRGNGKTAHGAFIYCVYVSPSVRQGGVGTAIITEVLRRAREWEGLERVVLDCDASNPAAVGLYEKLGFRSYGLEENAMKVDGEYVHLHHMELALR